MLFGNKPPDDILHIDTLASFLVTMKCVHTMCMKEDHSQNAILEKLIKRYCFGQWFWSSKTISAKTKNVFFVCCFSRIFLVAAIFMHHYSSETAKLI